MVKAYGIAAAAFLLGIILIAVSTLSSLEKVELPEEDLSRFFGIAGAEVPVHDVVRDLGIALVIAGIISVSYESFVHQRLLDEIGKTALQGVVDLFRSTTGDEVSSQVETQILRSQVLRQGFVIDATYTWYDDSEAILICETTISYRLKNLSSSEIKYRVTAGIEKYTNGEYGYEGITHVKMPGMDLAGENLSGVLKADGGDVRIQFSETITISGDRHADVLMEYRTVHKRQDHQPWFTNVMADGVKLIVKKPVNLELTARAYHPNGDEFKPSPEHGDRCGDRQP